MLGQVLRCGFSWVVDGKRHMGACFDCLLLACQGVFYRWLFCYLLSLLNVLFVEYYLLRQWFDSTTLLYASNRLSEQQSHRNRRNWLMYLFKISTHTHTHTQDCDTHTHTHTHTYKTVTHTNTHLIHAHVI